MERPLPQSQICFLCRKYGIRRLSLFGSEVLGTARLDSDVDLLVEFHEDRVLGLFALAQLAEELSPLFEGRRVDLRSPRDLSKHFREDILASAEVLFAA